MEPLLENWKVISWILTFLNILVFLDQPWASIERGRVIRNLLISLKLGH
jgi:hypothetical protein